MTIFQILQECETLGYTKVVQQNKNSCFSTKNYFLIDKAYLLPLKIVF